MRTRLLLAACALSFVSTAPALAQRLGDAGRPSAVTSNTAGPYDPRRPTSDFWTSAKSVVHVSGETYVDEGGDIQVKRGVVALTSVAPDATLGVGLYKVAPYSAGDAAFRRMGPDGRGSHSRIAAVGLRIGF